MADTKKSVIVTELSRGEGATVARRLAACGVNVAAVDRDSGPLNQLKQEVSNGPSGIEAVVADVGSPRDVEGFVKRAVDRFGELDGVFNIAAILGEFRPIAGGDTLAGEIGRAPSAG